MNEIFHRVSIRKYKKQPVEKEKILQILKAAMQAPSACNQQPWEFYVVTDPEKIQKLSQTTPYAGCAAGAPVVIVPVYRKENLPALPMVSIDMGICIENMWLETDALGLGGVCIGVSPIQEWMDQIHQILERQRMLLFFHSLHLDIQMKSEHSRIVLIQTEFTLWNKI